MGVAEKVLKVIGQRSRSYVYKFVDATTTDLYRYSPDAVPPIHAVSYHVATDKPPPKMVTSSGLFLATIYNQSQLAGRKHVARYWSIKTAATAVPLSAHPFPLVITTKLAAAILGGGVRRRCSAVPVLPLWLQRLRHTGTFPLCGVEAHMLFYSHVCKFLLTYW